MTVLFIPLSTLILSATSREEKTARRISSGRDPASDWSSMKICLASVTVNDSRFISVVWSGTWALSVLCSGVCKQKQKTQLYFTTSDQSLTITLAEQHFKRTVPVASRSTKLLHMVAVKLLLLSANWNHSGLEEIFSHWSWIWNHSLGIWEK